MVNRNRKDNQSGGNDPGFVRAEGQPEAGPHRSGSPPTRPSTAPGKFYFDLSMLEPAMRREVIGLLERSARAGSGRLTDDRSRADYVGVFPGAGPGWESAHDWRGDPRLFVWDPRDDPSPGRRGFYCSLPSSVHDPTHHRTFPPPVRWNEQITAFPLGSAHELAGFMGGADSAVRRRIFGTDSLIHHPRIELRHSEPPRNGMFDRSGIPEKVSYAAFVQRAKFILCPRGRNIGGHRIFEAMEARRVPVIVSDFYVPPPGIEWANCAIFVWERDLDSLASILEERESDFPAMADAARRTWETHFAPERLLPTMESELQRIEPLPAAKAQWLRFLHAGHRLGEKTSALLNASPRHG